MLTVTLISTVAPLCLLSGTCQALCPVCSRRRCEYAECPTTGENPLTPYRALSALAMYVYDGHGRPHHSIGRLSHSVRGCRGNADRAFYPPCTGGAACKSMCGRTVEWPSTTSVVGSGVVCTVESTFTYVGCHSLCMALRTSGCGC